MSCLQESGLPRFTDGHGPIILFSYFHTALDGWCPPQCASLSSDVCRSVGNIINSTYSQYRQFA